ncbi:unnamed protein product [Blepharisma stoltei]|uniref:Uncharacterized protein n=1 Tax=Blepharisma stoltei TaxID=1481888 RepID=A0AAU9JTD2_9CILI|nr:unnamed protein product [Blepharisma stoltei]
MIWLKNYIENYRNQLYWRITEEPKARLRAKFWNFSRDWRSLKNIWWLKNKINQCLLLGRKWTRDDEFIWNS